MKLFTSDQVHLGFVGVGAMGSRLVRHLCDHGYQTTVYDLDRSKAIALVDHGAWVADSPAELAENADVILSCLTNDDAVRGVYLGRSGILSNAIPGKVVLEMSTISPATSRRLYIEGAKSGVNVMDVAISGSTPAVEKGTVVLLVGGDHEVFEAAQPIFQAVASHWFLMGPSGQATIMKLVVNAILGIEMQAIAEAIALGEAEGLDRKRLLDVLAQTAVIAPAHRGKLTRAERCDYSPQFPLGLMNKDYRLMLAAARTANITL
ncbi:MAG TPA: NAD(P)-dependent oxidoreductase, partial [Terriglobales bacterium]